jgi:hypothetical protein
MRGLLSTVGAYLRSLRSFFRCEVWERSNCRSCRSAAHFLPASERAARIHRACQEIFGCERYKLGKGSPGPVRDEEYLNLLISDPQTVDHRSGKLLPVLVNQVDGNGLSVLRDAATNQEFEVTFAEMKRGSDSRGQPRYLFGVCRFLASAVRIEDSVRYLGVYDTALPQRSHHADVCAPPLNSRREYEARKKRIIDKIGSSLIPVHGFRGGAFMKYARDDAVSVN